MYFEAALQPCPAHSHLWKREQLQWGRAAFHVNFDSLLFSSRNWTYSSHRVWHVVSWRLKSEPWRLLKEECPPVKEIPASNEHTRALLLAADLGAIFLFVCRHKVWSSAWHGHRQVGSSTGLSIPPSVCFFLHSILVWMLQQVNKPTSLALVLVTSLENFRYSSEIERWSFE